MNPYTIMKLRGSFEPAWVLLCPLTRVIPLFLFSTLLLFQSFLAAKPVQKPALDKLNLPGINLNMEDKCVDVRAEVALHEGLLELVACTPDSKEHESIVMIHAKAMHIHTALLLLWAKPGNPAMQKKLDEEGTRWIPIEPKGDPVEVFLVFPDEEGTLREHPISQFVAPADQVDFDGTPLPPRKEKFPSAFVFAGSHLVEDGPGPRKYVADYSGNVISISTFGDELLCLPGIYGHQNGGLSWQVNPDGLPPVGEKVILRLRPKVNPQQPSPDK
jgi:hypothetical protein